MLDSKTEQRNDGTTDHPCVVGMACRVPGATSPSRLWDNLINKKDVQSKMPADRFNVDAFYHPNGETKGSVSSIEKEVFTLADTCVVANTDIVDQCPFWLLS